MRVIVPTSSRRSKQFSRLHLVANRASRPGSASLVEVEHDELAGRGRADAGEPVGGERHPRQRTDLPVVGPRDLPDLRVPELQHAGAVDRAVELAKAAGCKRAVPLVVSAPFHCALMKPAQERLKVDLDAATFLDLSIPLINNWQAKEIRTGGEARRGLYEQVPNPVRWMESMRYLGSQGVTRFVEVGAGAVLTGLLKNIDPSFSGAKFGAAEDWDKLAAFLSA